MAHLQKLEAQVEVQCSAEKLFETLTGRLNELPRLCSKRILKTDAKTGDWKSAEAATRRWDLVVDGKPQYMTERMTADEESKTVHYTILDGEVMKNYCKNLDIKVQTVPMGEGRCLAKWTFEYEKLNENTAAPQKELDHMVTVTRDLAASIESDA